MVRYFKLRSWTGCICIKVITLINDQRDKVAHDLWIACILKAPAALVEYNDNHAKVIKLSLNPIEKFRGRRNMKKLLDESDVTGTVAQARRGYISRGEELERGGLKRICYRTLWRFGRAEC